jgi:hypothetical protein
MRGEGCELCRREGGGGKQHEAKFCHELKSLEKIRTTNKPVDRSVGATINS